MNTAAVTLPARRLPTLLGGVFVRPLDWLSGFTGRQAQNIGTAFVQIWANKGRALLTTLGIIIGVTSTITVVSMVQGFGNYVTDMLRGFGTNMLFVFPYSPNDEHGMMLGRVVLDLQDVRTVGARCEKIRRISPLVFNSATVEYGRQKLTDIEMQGATEEFQPIRRFFVDSGRFFSPIEVDNAAYVCVLGREMLRLLQCDERIVGDHIYLNAQRFRVIGLLEAKGNMMGENQDKLILIPYTTAIKLNPMAQYFLPFMIEATGEKDIEECSLEVTRVLRERHRIQPGDPNDFKVLRQDEFLRDFDRVKMIATSSLAGVVGISLIVGGIGVMNVMLVSVTERTREIGLRKSVGGRRRDILMQFLTEAVVLATVGGAIGIALGYSICYVASLHPSMVKVTVPLWAVALGLSFSAGVGIVFGIIPAFKAAILHPIDALRHE
ncbi:MAG TPA: ABC transporter permease [Phycisphaerae bacterium]|nr:ABC transporter permease [Phycisphaerae bacterium]